MTNKELVQTAFDHFSKGNIPGLLEMLSDDIIWEMNGPDLIPYAGVRNGKAGALDFFTKLAATHDFQVFEPQQYIAENDTVAATGVAKTTNKLTGKSSTNHWAMTWTFKDGKAIHYHNYSDTYDIAQSFIK